MTRRRDVPTLAFTVPEAAEAIRLSENTLRVWVREGIVRTVRWQSLDLVPRVELDRLIGLALENGGTLPTTGAAMASSSLAPAGRVEDGAIGAPVPRDTGSALGEVSAANVGPSASGRTGAPTTEKGGRRTPTSLTTTPA